MKRDDLMALFRRLDSNDDGSLTAGELAPLAKQMGMSGSGLMKQMDADNNKKVNFREFRRYLKRQ